MRVALSFRYAHKAGPYQKALTLAGLEALSFTPDSESGLGGVGGLVLTGGHDVDPSLYGAEKHPETDPPDRAHDDYEAALVKSALAMNLPILAICRGMQLFNVVCGGTLIQHLPTGKHRQPSGGVPIHEVTLFGVGKVAVNSRHHQAVDRVGEGLIVTATDPDDGVIEGISMPSARFAVAVQWHPEDMTDDPVQMRLFHAFADAVRLRS